MSNVHVIYDSMIDSFKKHIVEYVKQNTNCIIKWPVISSCQKITWFLIETSGNCMQLSFAPLPTRQTVQLTPHRPRGLLLSIVNPGRGFNKFQLSTHRQTTCQLDNHLLIRCGLRSLTLFKTLLTTHVKEFIPLPSSYWNWTAKCHNIILRFATPAKAKFIWIISAQIQICRKRFRTLKKHIIVLNVLTCF